MLNGKEAPLGGVAAWSAAAFEFWTSRIVIFGSPNQDEIPRGRVADPPGGSLVSQARHESAKAKGERKCR